MKTVKDIVSVYLGIWGYDGLFSETDGGCQCLLDDDLMNCANPGLIKCRPGHKVVKNNETKIVGDYHAD